jgi:cytochrome c556
MRRNPAVALVLFVVSVAALSAQQSSSATDRDAMIRSIDAKRERYAGVAKGVLGLRRSRIPGAEEQRAAAAAVERGTREDRRRSVARHPVVSGFRRLVVARKV